VDFRPFKNGANIAAIKQKEVEASNSVKVLAMKMKNKTTGEVKEISYEEYLKNLESLTQEFETIEQIKSDHVITPTKISDFSVTDFEGNEVSDLYLTGTGFHMMVPVYKAKYEMVPEKKTVIDSIFSSDTIAVQGFKDSIQVVKVFQKTEKREVDGYKIFWDAAFITEFNGLVKPWLDNAKKKNVAFSVVMSGVDSEKATSLAGQTGVDCAYYTADEKLLKTMIRSNPGFILWKDGVLVHKWHKRKLPTWEDLELQYMK